MKKIIFAVTLFSLAVGCTTVQQTGSIKQVELTPQTLASQPADKPWLINLTLTGTVYNVADDIDYSRVRVLLPPGEMAMSDLVRKLGMTRKKFLLGSFSDLSGQYFGPSPDAGTSSATCGDLLCECQGWKDCNDLDRAGLCIKSSWGCAKIPGLPNGCVCLNKKGF
jgi:hypothetical protein